MTTGYRVSLHDFRDLLFYPEHRLVIAPLLLLWYGVEVRPLGKVATLHDPAGRRMTIGSVHAAIQADPEQQGRLYREAMTLWH